MGSYTSRDEALAAADDAEDERDERDQRDQRAASARHRARRARRATPEDRQRLLELLRRMRERQAEELARLEERKPIYAAFEAAKVRAAAAEVGTSNAIRCGMEVDALRSLLFQMRVPCWPVAVEADGWIHIEWQPRGIRSVDGERLEPAAGAPRGRPPSLEAAWARYARQWLNEREVAKALGTDTEHSRKRGRKRKRTPPK